MCPFTVCALEVYLLFSSNQYVRIAFHPINGSYLRSLSTSRPQRGARHSAVFVDMRLPVSLLYVLLQLCLARVVSSVTANEYATLRMLQPVHGTVVSAPLYLQASLATPSLQALLDINRTNATVCIELDTKPVRCKPLNVANPMNELVEEVALGVHTARFVIRTPQDPEFIVSDKATFTLVKPNEYVRQMQELQTEQEQPNLLTWARSYYEGESTQQPSSTRTKRTDHDPAPDDADGNQVFGEETLLIVGVKTNLMSRFAHRQAIRETWANKQHLLPGIRVFFIGCRLDMTAQSSSAEHLRAISLERQLYGDLLTDELDCDDSYQGLVKKCTEFLHFVTSRAPERLPMYVMMADDDIYVRVNDLAQMLYEYAPRSKYFAGQVSAEEFGRPQHPVRDLNHKNYLSKNQYPMSEFPPFASGVHYVLSLDCAQFIANNRHELRAVGALDDVSVAIWLMSVGIHVQHSSLLRNIHSFNCEGDSLVSYADISVIGIRSIYANLQARQGFCHGFNRTTWSQINVSSLRQQQRGLYQMILFED